MALEPARLADFQLLAPLGKGATSQVFDAVHRATGRPVAIKTLQISSSEDRDEIVERFAREALVVSNVRSRYVGQVLGFGFERSQPFLVLERLYGETIDGLLRRERVVPIAEGLAWMAELMAGLADCHAAGVIHRDIKPANVFLVEGPTEPRYAKVIDFGVARADRGQGDLTSAQHLLGSVGYMAPEQFVSALGVGPSADIYAVGVTIFRCFSGRLPFLSKNVHEVIRKKLSEPPPALSSLPDTPQLPPLDAFLGRALARDPNVRFRTVREMADSWAAMRRALEGQGLVPAVAPPPAPNVRPAAPPPNVRPAAAPILVEEDVLTSEAVSASELVEFLDGPETQVPVTAPGYEGARVLVPFAAEGPTSLPSSATFSVPIPSFAETAEREALPIELLTAPTSEDRPFRPALGAAGFATLRHSPPQEAVRSERAPSAPPPRAPSVAPPTAAIPVFEPPPLRRPTPFPRPALRRISTIPPGAEDVGTDAIPREDLDRLVADLDRERDRER